MFFFAATIYILERFRQNGTKLIWLLPVVIILWCNIHGGIFSGLGIISIYFLLSFVRREKSVKTLFFVTLLSYLALLINPYGVSYPAYLYSAVVVPRPFIEDWQCILHPKFLFPYSWIIVLFAIMFIIKIIRDFKNKSFDIYHYSLIIPTVYFGFAHVKGIELAAIVIFMFCLKDLDYYLSKLKRIKTFEKSLYAAIFIMALIIPFNINTPRLTFNHYPVKEVEFLKINNIKGNVLVIFEMGSFITYKLYPNNKVFIDGRFDGVYPMDVYNANNVFFMLKNKHWEDAVTKYPTDIIILDKSDTVRLILLYKSESEWKEVYAGNRFCVLIKKDKVRDDYKMPTDNLSYYRANLFKTDFIKQLKDEKNG